VVDEGRESPHWGVRRSIRERERKGGWDHYHSIAFLANSPAGSGPSAQKGRGRTYRGRTAWRTPFKGLEKTPEPDHP